MRLPGLIAALLVIAAGQAQAADAAKGEAVFKRCMACHTIADGAPARVGPNLHGVVGRTAGTAPGYTYSKAMAASGLTWTPETLDSYLTAPRNVVPGTKMSFPGVPNAAQRADLIAYLQSQSE